MNKFKSKLALLVVVLLAFTLSSCLFPEEFKVEVEIRKEGTFRFSYDGILTFVLGKEEEVKKGSLSPKANQEIEEFGQGLKKEDKGFKKWEYIGHSQYRVLYEKEGSLDSPFFFVDEKLNLFSIIPNKDGLVEVRGLELDDKDIRDLKSIRLTIDGELTVKTDGDVVNHNANSTPNLFGLIGGYGWKIMSMNDPPPKILIKIE